MMRVNIDVRKTVLLFVTIHLMIAWVAERKDKKSANNLTFSKSAVFSSMKTMTDVQYGSHDLVTDPGPLY